MQTNQAQLETKSYLTRVQRKVEVEAVRVLFSKPLTLKLSAPLVSFTFDDFFQSAFLQGGSILQRYGARGTYYASLGLMGKQSRLGQLYNAENLRELIRVGHEVGCHTFDHCHSWTTAPDAYERAIIENQKALTELLPETSFRTFAYPHSEPRLSVKRIAGNYFRCCRGGGLKARYYLDRHWAGGQTFNRGVIDLNYLCAFFLEKSRDNPEAIKLLIDQNAQAKGWLIFATHDVCKDPSPFGCTPEFFERVVQWSLESGAQILPVVNALDLIQAGDLRKSPSAQRTTDAPLVGGAGAV